MSKSQIASNQFQFFLKVKKDLGVVWLETKDFKISDSTLGETPCQLWEKNILGSRKGSIMKQPDYVVNIRFVCIAKDGIVEEAPSFDEKEVTIVLKSYSSNSTIISWMVKDNFYKTKEETKKAIDTILQGTLGLTGKNIETPIIFHNRVNAEKTTLTPIDIDGKEGYYYHRLTRVKTQAYHASTIELYILKHGFGYVPTYSVNYLEIEKSSGQRPMTKPLSLGDAIVKIDNGVKSAREKRKYVGPESVLYIPEGANSENWNFVLHKWKSDAMKQPESKFISPVNKPSTNQAVQSEPESVIEPDPGMEDDDSQNIYFKKPILDLTKLFGQKKDFEGYFSGEVPDIAGDLVGSQSVDTSQISSMFSGTNEAVSLVNSYTSDALKNVAYIFNFSKGGAYGVYIPALDRAIKTKALKKQLEQKGYKIVEENGMLTAHPTKEETTPEQIDKDIHSLWEQLNASGGSALGINMGDVLKATDQNTSKIISDIRQQVSDAPPQIESILKEVLGVYHLAAIILHEASHAKGGDEGKAQSDEQSFRSWAQSYLNKQYQSKLSSSGLEDFYSPLELGTEVLHASSKNWYRTAQGFMGKLNYSPSSGSAPKGSDISGRYQGAWQSGGFAEWAMMVQQDQSTPIEQRLNRSKMAILEPDVDQENNIIEEQLRKQFKNDFKPNVQLITEELLSPSRDVTQGYKTLETMLEELRPQPLMTPIQKSAMTKISSRENCLFGWYNNLSVSDGSTIPGLSDRVMAWDDRDESFAAEEDWIKKQERYNPEYDLKGFYYRWIEPHFKPQLFDDMTREYSNTHPAKRFAAKLDPSLTKVLGVIKLIEEEIINERIKATRIVVSEDMVNIVKRLLDQEGIRLKAYKVSDSDNIFSIWAYGGNVSEDSLDKAEQYFQNADGSEEYKDIIEDILSTKKKIASSVEEVVNLAKEMCKEYEIDDLYIIGEYARKIYEREASPHVFELDFSCETIDAGLKLGSILANKLNVPTEYVILGQAGISFAYNGIRIFFSKSPYYQEMGEQMQDNGYNIEDPVLRDICNKDFTINMMAYDVRNMKVIDPIGVKTDVKNKIIKTLFDPSFIIDTNPMVIMRALSFKLENYILDEDLERSIIENINLLESGRFSPQRLKFTRQYIQSKGDAESLFNEYGLNQSNQEI